MANNESSEVILMLDNFFDGNNYYPEALRVDIGEINNYIYRNNTKKSYSRL